MKKRKKLLILCKGFVAVLVTFMFGFQAFCQPVTITGQVTDQNGEALPGAYVRIQGTQAGTVTDANGNYSVDASTGTVLVFTYIGYEDQELVVGASTVINVVMTESAQALGEVVVTGYQTQRKVDLTGAISVVDMDQLTERPSSNAMQSMQGRVPGLYIETSGLPNGQSNTVLIRGLNTLGNNDPLYIIDGVPTKNQDIMQSIDPTSIETIQVLKDASAASIYGSRASNGVIIITTKAGVQHLKVDITSSITSQYHIRMLDVLNTIERGEVLWQASMNDGTDPAAHSALYSYDYTGTGFDAILNKVTPVEWIGGDESYGLKAQIPGTDWQDVVYRTGRISQINMTVSGGTDQGTVLLSLGYLYNKGVMEYTDFRKLTARINSSYNILGGKITIGENLQLSSTADTPVTRDLGGSTMENLANFLQPILPVYTVDGEWSGPVGSGFSDRNNPLHMLYIHRKNKNTDKLIFGNLYADFKVIPNLTIRSSFGIDMGFSHNWVVEESYQTGFLGRSTNSLTESRGDRFNWTWSNTANYDLTIGDHTINILAGIEAIKNYNQDMSAYKENFALQDYDYLLFLDAATGSQTAGGNATGHQLVSYFGKVNYNLLDRYLASITLRYDGSSRFGSENQFGLFPAATLGWRINNESFFNIPIVSNLKLRAGVGRVGNQEIGDLAKYGLYETSYTGTDGSGRRSDGTAYDLNNANTGTLPSGYVRTQLANENLKWETTDEINVGIDIGFLGERITGSFDYYFRKTNDILIRPPYPGVVGEGGDRWENGATIENKGFELVLGYRGDIGDVTYNINGSIQSFHDEITYLPESVVRSYAGNVEQTILGHSQTSVFGYKTDGLFQTQAEVDAHATQPGKGIGRMRFVDLNNDGVIDPLDQYWIGTRLPDFEYGLNAEFGFKGITLSMFWQGVAGKSVSDGVKRNTDFVGTIAGMNYGARTLDAWHPVKNPNSTIPMLSLVNANNETRTSNYFYVNGSYLKLRSLQLAYSIPRAILQRARLEMVRVYVLGENLILIKDTKGSDAFTSPDPETPGDLYPRPTTVTFGINISL